MLKLKNNLRRILKEKNVTQLMLSEMTGIRQAGISELINLRRRVVNIEHLELILNALEITDVSRLFEIEGELSKKETNAPDTWEDEDTSFIDEEWSYQLIASTADEFEHKENEYE